MPDDQNTNNENIDTDTPLNESVDETNYAELEELIKWDLTESGYNSVEDAMDDGWGVMNTIKKASNKIAELVSGKDNDTEELGESVMTNSITGIFGIPYQFDPIVDPPVSGYDNVGRKYIEKILSVMPVLFLTPGEPVYMGGATKGLAQSLSDLWVGSLNGEDVDDIGKQLTGEEDGRYYTFTSNFPEYQRYANIALRALAKFMGLENYYIPKGSSNTKGGGMFKLGNIRVEYLLNQDFNRLFGAPTTIPFYLDSETSISESFSNDTTESMLSQYANQGSEMARQMQFLAGTRDLGGLVGSVTEAVSTLGGGVTENLASALDGALQPIIGKGVISRIATELTTVVTGGKIVFPEIWNSSSYSRSYSIRLKLRSPDPDPVSIFLNIYVPIILLISMAAPLQMDNSANSYKSPFIVRATYKSIFNCDLGIISSLDIDKGGEDKWNALGMPLQADVNVTIKDLYSTFFISKGGGLFNNTAQLDYLAMMAGIDMNKYEPFRLTSLGATLAKGAVTDIGQDVLGGIKQGLNRRANSLLSVISDTRFTS